MKETLYLLQVQPSEVALYQDLYYPTEEALNKAIQEAKIHKVINYERDSENVSIPVWKMRVFKMIDRILIYYGKTH